MKKIFTKKFVLALMFFVSGTTMAFMHSSSLGEYTAFAAIIVGIFGAADVTDKHLNDGNYYGE